MATTDASPAGGRKRPMEILSLGPSRTATASMAAAYEVLGVPTYHGYRLITYPEEGAAWERAADAKFFNKGQPLTREEWDEALFKDFAALADICFMFWEELLEAYPEAKVVLVERDVDAWWKSFSEGILPGLYSKKVDFIVNYVEPAVGPRTAHACRKMYGGYLGSGWGPEQLEVIKANAKDRYREHFRRIREVVPRERLLNYELGSGWGPLCEFLDKPVPDVPFPRVNEAEIVQRRIKEATTETMMGGIRALGLKHRHKLTPSNFTAQMATPRYAQQQVPYGAPQAYGQPELQGQQGYSQEHQGYGEEDAQYAHEDQGYEHEEGEDQYAQHPQDPSIQQANGEANAKGMPEQSNPEMPQADDSQAEEAELPAQSQKTQAPFQPRRHFPQDPHHSKLMSHFHDIAEHGLTDDHIHSMIHVGSYFLATLAKHTGMTAGHKEEGTEAPETIQSVPNVQQKPTGKPVPSSQAGARQLPAKVSPNKSAPTPAGRPAVPRK
ncbi:hypothetical protein KC351_g2634 [Hortaea werneckii]|nr:hypothetical protein KC351_g2634 [Hortaea werneckii]